MNKNWVKLFFILNLKQLLTRTRWWVIPIVWLPVVCWFVSISLRRGVAPPQAALCVVGGIFIWTLLEYTLHRFLFHKKTTTYWSACSFLLSSVYFHKVASQAKTGPTICAGGTLSITLFTAAITSTPWMHYDSFSLLLPLQFYLCQYVIFFLQFNNLICLYK